MANEMQSNAVNQNQGSKHAEALLNNLKSADKTKVAPRVFRSNIMSMRFIFKNGKVAAFLSGKYVTDIKHEIEELDEEVANGHPNINCNPEETVETIEPLEALKAKHFKEFMEAQAKTLNKNNDAGFSEEKKLNVLNSNHVADAMAGSDSSGNNATNPNPVTTSSSSGGVKINIGNK